jgi:hypothetical protein
VPGLHRRSCGVVNRSADVEALFEPVVPAAHPAQIGVLFQQVASGLIEQCRSRRPAAVLLVRELIPLRELVDDVKELRRAGCRDRKHEAVEVDGHHLRLSACGHTEDADEHENNRAHRMSSHRDSDPSCSEAEFRTVAHFATNLSDGPFGPTWSRRPGNKWVMLTG